MDSASGHIHRICIVDDDASIRDSMRALLESYGFETQAFSSAAAFLSTPFSYCCLIVDYSMPVTDGLALLELLRAGDIATPALLMTDKYEPTLVVRTKALGIHVSLVKPIRETKLVRSIEAACTGWRCAS